MDRWIFGAPVLVLLDLALLAVVHARPGRLGVVLWHVAPSVLVLLASAVLAWALVASRRERHRWNGPRVVALAGLLVVIASPSLYRVYPGSRDRIPSTVRFELPLDGWVRVAWGGADPADNYHVLVPDQRWAYDLLVTDDGASHSGSGKRLEEYLAYGRPVEAPAVGVVRIVRDGEPDLAIGAPRPAVSYGNFVVLEVAPREYLYMAHLKPGSIAVRPGETVRAGQVVGRVGNSGNSSEPHVHLHLQDRPEPFLAEGIPFYFHDYEEGGVHVSRGMPQGGIRDGRFVGAIVRRAPVQSPGPAPGLFWSSGAAARVVRLCSRLCRPSAGSHPGAAEARQGIRRTKGRDAAGGGNGP